MFKSFGCKIKFKEINYYNKDEERNVSYTDVDIFIGLDSYLLNFVEIIKQMRLSHLFENCSVGGNITQLQVRIRRDINTCMTAVGITKIIREKNRLITKINENNVKIKELENESEKLKKELELLEKRE